MSDWWPMEGFEMAVQDALKERLERKEPVKQYSISIEGISAEEAKARLDAIRDMLNANPDAKLPDYVDVKVVLPEEEFNRKLYRRVKLN